jgi:hypothetical protein
MSITTYCVTIEMSNSTVQALLGQGSALVMFSAVQGSDASALPLVWHRKTTFGNRALLQWQTTYQAYASSTPIAPGMVVVIATSQPVDLGQTLTVGEGPTGVVKNGGTAATITVANATRSPFTCGIEQTVAQTSSPVCIYPLFGQNTQTITPLPQIVLLFTTAPVVVGEAFSDTTFAAPASSPTIAPAADASLALSINMGKAPVTSVAVCYDVNNGWSWGNGSWGATISTSQLVSTLIQPNPPPSPIARPKDLEK